MSALAISIDLHAVYARNDNTRRVVAGLAAATPTLAESCQQLDRALDDVPALGTIVARLSAELAGTRLGQASLLAAIRATIEAHADGETDPLACLPDELAAQEARHGQEV